MSRSRRKNPIFGITTCRSEQQDKKIWHQRWRSRERTALTSATPSDLEAYLPVLEKQVSNVWSMGKDGRQYWSIKRQAVIAEQTAQKKGCTTKERASIKQRELHKSMGK
ncbi:MAG TPA: hypothetical protein DDY37_06445 [Legionella sp.]|nr:hypothetical protein [Legionella sp.]